MKNEGAIPRLRVAGVLSPRAAFWAVPGACPFLQLHLCPDFEYLLRRNAEERGGAERVA